MGEVRVPAAAQWAAQTQRAVENFPISGRPIDRRLIRALALIKAEAAAVNAELKDVRGGRRGGRRRHRAGGRRGGGRAAGTTSSRSTCSRPGSGTSSNMNANEVIATLASEHLGRGRRRAPQRPRQRRRSRRTTCSRRPSTWPPPRRSHVDLLPALEHLARSLRRKAREFAKVVKSGRTHLMDATPVTLGQEFGGYATQVRAGRRAPREPPAPARRAPARRHRRRHRHQRARGASPARWSSAWPSAPTCRSPRPRTTSPPRPSRDALVEASGQLRTAAVALVKIANDIRWMALGPRTGLAEIRLPDLQPGSSIMPGKVNPVLCEAVTQVGAQVIGNDAAVAFGGSQGNFELNVYLPVMARNLLESIELLANVVAAVRRPLRRRHRGQRGALPLLRRVLAVDRHVAQPVHRLREDRRAHQGEHRRPATPIRDLVLEREAS